MPDWTGPRWRQEGRTGPGPIAPRYANRKDRNTVRRGDKVSKDANPGGPGGRRRKIQTNKPLGKTSHQKKNDGCWLTALVLLASAATAATGVGWAVVAAVQAAI